MSEDLTELTAVSPVDGRYGRLTAGLRQHCSEYGLMRYRVQVEVNWLLMLASEPGIRELPEFNDRQIIAVEKIASDFSHGSAQRIKQFEATTNHDVKAVEYFVKEQLQQLDDPALAGAVEFVHFACTSEDINNLAYAMMLRDALGTCLLPEMGKVIHQLAQLADQHKALPMLARTHGQAASPTSLGKEMANVAARLLRQYVQLSQGLTSPDQRSPVQALQVQASQVQASQGQDLKRQGAREQDAQGQDLKRQGAREQDAQGQASQNQASPGQDAKGQDAKGQDAKDAKVLGLQLTGVLGKFNGAVGNFNAHLAAYPEVNWLDVSQRFVESQGLAWNAMTTQIEPHDNLAEIFHNIMRFNVILTDLCRDLWGYIALGYFRQRKVEGETGSSTMPHKVNPIDFENAEGNLGLANGLLGFMAEKLPVSRWQRDLTDSTVLRNLGPCLAYSQIAYLACLKGLGKLEVDQQRITNDLDNSWEVLAEPLQTLMRKHGITEPYEQIKAATRGKRFDQQDYFKSMMSQIPDLPVEVTAALAAMSPANYIGEAVKLTDHFLASKPLADLMQSFQQQEHQDS